MTRSAHACSRAGARLAFLAITLLTLVLVAGSVAAQSIPAEPSTGGASVHWPLPAGLEAGDVPLRVVGVIDGVVVADQQLLLAVPPADDRARAVRLLSGSPLALLVRAARAGQATEVTVTVDGRAQAVDVAELLSRDAAVRRAGFVRVGPASKTFTARVSHRPEAFFPAKGLCETICADAWQACLVQHCGALILGCDPCDIQLNVCLDSCQCVDPDNDGVCNPADNCPNHSNANQADCDNDGIGDVCDPLNATVTETCGPWSEVGRTSLGSFCEPGLAIRCDLVRIEQERSCDRHTRFCDGTHVGGPWWMETRFLNQDICTFDPSCPVNCGQDLDEICF